MARLWCGTMNLIPIKAEVNLNYRKAIIYSGNKELMPNRQYYLKIGNQPRN